MPANSKKKSGKRRRSDSSSDEEVEVKKRKSRAFWSSEEDEVLESLKEAGQSWEMIAKSFPGRDHRSYENRYLKYIKEGEKRACVAWTQAEDELLKTLREKSGQSWEKIVKSFTS
jgi:hypothetical protein